MALSIVLEHFEKSTYGNILKFIFTGMVNRSSKMNRVHFNNFFFGGGGWNAGHMKGTLYVPNISVETSILEQLDDKLNSLLRALPYLPKHNCNTVSVASADNILVPDNSIDYIFIDPPFGANIMYSELNYIVEGWLKVITNNNSEAIENRVQGKDPDFYQSMMTRCFMEYYRVLKPGKWITIEFSNTKASVWNSIQRSLSNAGFIIANVSAIDKATGKTQAISIKASGGLSDDEIDQMVKDAEAHAEEDKKRKDLIQEKNSAQEMVNSATKMLEENADKIPDDLKNEIKSCAEELQKTAESDNVDEIKAGSDKLLKAMSKAGEMIYKAAQAQQQATGASEAENSAGAQQQSQASGDENVVDADFTEVKDDNNK